MKYGNQPLWKRILSSPFVLILLLIVVVFLARAAKNLHNKAELSEARLTQATNELAKLEARRNDLGEKVSKLSTNEGLESEIRSKFRAVKDGESLAVIIDDGGNASTSVATSTEEVGWFRSILQKFGM